MRGVLPLLPTPALAVEATPARLCADAASGSEVEVCLTLAATYPNDVDGIAAALRAHLDRAASPDRELMLALLAFLAEDTAVAATERLADLGDPRALPPLVHAVERRELPVAVAAVTALPAWPAALAPLSAWIVDADLALPVRLAAADALGALGTAEAHDVLADLLRRPGVPATLRGRARAAIQTAWPGRASDLPRRPSTDGAPWVAVGSAWALGTAMGAAGHLGHADLLALGVVSGAAAGGTAGYLFARAWPMEAGDAAFVTSSVVLGGAGARFLGEGDASWWLALGGTAAGYGLGYGLRAVHPGGAMDAVEAAGVSLAAGAGASVFGPRATGVGLLAGLAVGHAVAPALDLALADGPLLALGVGAGAAAGWFVAPDTGPRLGGAAGALTGYATAGLLDVPDDVVLASVVGAGFGGAVGGGIARATRTGPALALVGGVAGLAGGAAFAAATPEPVDDRDVWLVGLASGWAVWQTAGWTYVARGGLSGPPGGLVLAVPAAVGIGAALVAIEVDLPASHGAAAVSLGVWGGWLGGATGHLLGDWHLEGALVGSNLGLGAGALALGPAAGLPPLVVGLADAGGVLGASLGAIGASLATADRDTITVAALVGSGVGLGAGAVAGTVWRRSGSTRDVALRLPQVRLAPWGLQDGWGVRVGVDGW